MNRNRQKRYAGLRGLLASVVMGALLTPVCLGAATSARVIVGFKERYGSENKQHLGCDVAWIEGSELYAPVAGTISFYGRVPGSAGLNVMALTITTMEGWQVSLNPLKTAAVVKGERVSKGQTVGTLSAIGDPSSEECHVHLSLRVGGVYRDPSDLLSETLDADGKVTVGNSSGATGIGLPSSAAGSTSSSLEPSGGKAGTATSAEVKSNVLTPKQVEESTIAASLAKKSAKEEVRPAKETKTESSTSSAKLKSSGKQSREMPVAGATASLSGDRQPFSARYHAVAESGFVKGTEQSVLQSSGSPSVDGRTHLSEKSGVGNGRSAWSIDFASMSRGSLALMLFGVGVALSCAGIGVMVVARRLGLNPLAAWRVLCSAPGALAGVMRRRFAREERL